MPKLWWFKCQNSSCFKQNYFGVLNAQKVAIKMPKNGVSNANIGILNAIIYLWNWPGQCYQNCESDLN